MENLKFLLLLLSITFLGSAQADCNFSKSKFKSKIDGNSAGKIKRLLKRKKYKNLDNPTCLAKALIYAISKKHMIAANYLLTRNVDLNYIDHSTHTSPLAAAIYIKNNIFLNKILEAGANPKLMIEDKTMLDIALPLKNYNITRTLEKFGAQETLDCSLKNSMDPKCYHERDSAVLKVALLYYGDGMKMSDLDRIEPILKKRFFEASERNVQVEIIVKKVMRFQKRMPEDFKYNGITDKKRLQRIWYYENVGTGIMEEVYKEYKKVESDQVLDELDAIVAITGGQFNGLGFASGRVSVTKYPQETAWGLEGGGSVDYPSDYSIVDELVHELGHNMFLGHTSTQCTPQLEEGEDFQQKHFLEMKACCNASPAKDDVMSYCRNRGAVNESFMHKFESCNIEMIKDLIIPAMLEGKRSNFKNRKTCK
jgi:hypothetical protein